MYLIVILIVVCFVGIIIWLEREWYKEQKKYWRHMGEFRKITADIILEDQIVKTLSIQPQSIWIDLTHNGERDGIKKTT